MPKNSLPANSSSVMTLADGGIAMENRSSVIDALMSRPQSWIDQEAERDAVYANRRRIRGDRGQAPPASVWSYKIQYARASPGSSSLTDARRDGPELSLFQIYSGSSIPEDS
jgi:hypothetical protein